MYIHHLDCGGVTKRVYICTNLPNCTLYVQFTACQLCLNKSLGKESHKYEKIFAKKIFPALLLEMGTTCM